MPDVIRDDMAFIDRIHFYLPGWEVPEDEGGPLHLPLRLRGGLLRRGPPRPAETQLHGDHGPVLHPGASPRRPGPEGGAEDRLGPDEVIYPHGKATKEELAELVELAMEGRRRVKEQLKKMGSFEYYHTSFSYQDKESGDERFVGVPEQGGRDLIAADPLAPGSVYTGSINAEGTVGLYRLEVTLTSGTSKLKPAGGVSGTMKESIARAFSYLQSKKIEFGVGREVDSMDFHVEAIDLMQQRRRGRRGRGVLRRGLLGAAAHARDGRHADPGRHEHFGRHQGTAVAERDPPVGDGQRREARPAADRQQAPVPGRQWRRGRAR